MSCFRKPIIGRVTTGNPVGLTLALVLLLGSTGWAQATRSVRILTYNIHHGAGTDGRVDLERIADVIRGSQADCVALQEVDVRVSRSGGVDQAQRLAELTGLEVLFCRSIDLDGGAYGNAILSRWPLGKTDRLELPRPLEGEPRTIARARIKISGTPIAFTLLATHFDHRSDPAERLASIDALETWVANETGPLILAGDLNASRESRELQQLLQHWQAPNALPFPTFPAEAPRIQIDHILIRQWPEARMGGLQVLDAPVASDHAPLLLELRVPLADEQP